MKNILLNFSVDSIPTRHCAKATLTSELVGHNITCISPLPTLLLFTVYKEFGSASPGLLQQSLPSVGTISRSRQPSKHKPSRFTSSELAVPEEQCCEILSASRRSATFILRSNSCTSILLLQRRSTTVSVGWSLAWAGAVHPVASRVIAETYHRSCLLGKPYTSLKLPSGRVVKPAESDKKLQTANMSATTQKTLGELPHAGPTFSYAQAAKGRSPSGPSSVSTEKVSKGAGDVGSTTVTTAEDQGTTPRSDGRATKRAASEGRHTYNDREPIADTEPLARESPDTNRTPAAATPATQASAQSQVVVSTPSSPEFGVTSASTLPKDDDLFSNANASSDSTWEKLSQGSQNGSRSHDKGDNEKESNENASWDEAPPASTGLKDAPPPAVNFWTQRIEAKAAKQPPKPSHANIPSSANAAINTNGAMKPFDIGAESRKHGNKKQPKRYYGGLDEKPVTVGAKDGVKYADGRARSGEVIESAARHTAQAFSVDRSPSTPMARPPPPSDAHSWPTPDSAQDEGRKKAQERAERGEKEKAPASKTHGKEKWMPVPYVPTVQFSTPIPTVRRGARAPRGGRDSGPRLASSGTERPRANSPDASVGPQLVLGECSKAEIVSPRNASSNPRPKRASSAGPASARDQRRSSETTVSEKRNDSSRFAQTTNVPSGTAVIDSRRASALTQNGTTRTKGFATNATEAEFQAEDGKGSQNHASIHDRYEGASDTHAHPQSAGFERRGEGSFRTHEHVRDYHHSAPVRERGEGRPERGRGGYRSRGAGNHAFAHASIANGHVAPHAFVPPPMPAKSYSNHERRASQVQHANYQSPPSNGRPARSGSRSHSITHPPTFSRYPQGPHTTPGSHLHSLHTDVGDGWAYQPASQGVMSAHPYNAYMEQMSIFGMVSMQM